MNNSAPTIFESFNARSLRADQVAATFVPSANFENLCKRRHTIVVGPRGSGKTTLLKMLQPLALETWAHSSSDDLIRRVDFTGVFIATDISWSEQLASLGHGRLDASAQHLLSGASFTTHVLRSLVTTIEQRCGKNNNIPVRNFRRIQLDPEQEKNVVQEIASTWHVGGIVPTLFGLRQALTRRLLHIRELASKLVLLGTDECLEHLARTQYLHLHFLQSCTYAVEVFEQAAAETGGKWALMFDELEIAPRWVHSELVRSLRSTDERFLFKLALNPFTENTELLQAPTSAAPGQDFDQIALWYAEKRDAYDFCEQLWREVMREKGFLKMPSPVQLLGKSHFESPPSDSVTGDSAYGRGSRWARRFSALAAKDASFRTYLNDHALDPENLDLKQGAERAAEVRKVAPIVAVREFYRRDDNVEAPSGGTRRSRKNPSLYAGAESVFAISEGNPRWFIGLMNHILAGVDNPGLKISPGRQATELVDAAQRFTATLRTIPVPQDALNKLSVLQLVRSIGEYFHAETVLGEFRPEPPGSIIVDSSSPESLIGVLAQGLNSGALVYVPDDDGKLILSSLRGKRFRLSYLLAPLYGFPIRLGKPVALSRIISKRGSSAKQVDSAQLPLTGEKLHE